MYHNNIKNQLFKRKKSLLTTSFAQKDSQTVNYTPIQNKILSFFKLYRHASFTKFTNEYIALSIGCSTKTVTRATNQFLKDGLITKCQKNRYAPNDYTFNNKIDKARGTFSHWINSLSSTNQNLYISHGIRIDHDNKIIFSYENVPHNKKSLILDKYLSRRTLTLRAGARKVSVKIRDHKKGARVNTEQKKLILDNRHDPRIKDILANPKISAEIITQPIQQLTTLMNLEAKEYYRMIAFSNETIEHVLSIVDPIVTGRKVLREVIKNKMAWIISIATAYCKKNNLIPDWKWYYTVCEIMGMSTQNEQVKPLITKALEKPMVAQKGKKFFPTTLARLEHELCKREERLVKYGGSFLDKKTIAKLKEEINELKGSNEKQTVLYQNNSYSMETSGAYG
jgi:hypothetical protein